MKTLLIMRHGEAESFAATDQQRELTEKGKVDVRVAGQYLLSLQLPFTEVWVSPYIRTQQTADGVLSVLSAPNTRINKDCLVPESNPQQVLNEVANSVCDHLILISHQPLVSRLITLLNQGNNSTYQDIVPMSPASMAMLTAEYWLAGCFELNWLRHAPLFDSSER